MKEVLIPVKEGELKGNFSCPKGAKGIVLFIHGTGSSRLSARNNQVAAVLEKGDIGYLLFNLFTLEEGKELLHAPNIPMLTSRVLAVLRWVLEQPECKDLPIGLFGAGIGGALSLFAAAIETQIKVIVLRGGRTEPAEKILHNVEVPILFLVGGKDEEILEQNKKAAELLPGKTALSVVGGATHLFEEEGAIEVVAMKAFQWFAQNL